MLRLFYKVVWLWGHGHHARRASKITFVQRPNTSAVCTHGTQAAMLKNFSWKIFTPKQPEMSTNWFMSRLRRSHCQSLQVSCTLRLPCILSAIFSLGSFTPKETLKRSSASWPCLTPFTTLLNDCRWRIEQEEGVKLPCSCQPQDKSCWRLLDHHTSWAAEHWHQLEAESTLAASLTRNWKYVASPGFVWFGQM